MNDSGSNKRGTYSIAIRTIGKAGDKYQKLLNSIKKVHIKPEKVVVVLPEGYEPPKEQLGTEEFLFCDKSMIQQRIEALKAIDSDYTLFLDDDIEFEPNFVEKLLDALDSRKFDCATGPLFSFFPQSIAGKIAGFLMGNVAFRLINRGYYVRILRNGCWTYRYVNTQENRYYPTESFAWTCFMIRTEVMRNLAMEDEKIWIEKNGYAWGDDRVMAYKLVCNGYKACIVSDALYVHNDAKTSTKGAVDKVKVAYCSSFFSRVFWQRFIQDPDASMLSRALNSFCLRYTYSAELLYHMTKNVLSSGAEREVSLAFKKGFLDACDYVQSDEYRSLLPIKHG